MALFSSTVRKNRPGVRWRLAERCKITEHAVANGVHSVRSTRVTDVTRNEHSGFRESFASECWTAVTPDTFFVCARGGRFGRVSPLAARLHDLGECELKYGLRLHLFNLYKDGLGQSTVPRNSGGKEKHAPAI